MATGVVKFFNENRGWGFIRGDDGVEVYVHWKGCIGGYIPAEGEAVQYEPRTFSNGNTAAQQVCLIE